MKEALIRLQPFGLTVAGNHSRPLLLLRDESSVFTLPVPLSPLEAGVTLSQSNTSAPPSTPHRVTQMLLESLGMRISRCVFKDVKPLNLWVELQLEGHPGKKKKLELRADEAMSLCLHLEVPIFASKAFIQKSRTTVADLQGQIEGFQLNPKVLQRTHTYIM